MVILSLTVAIILTFFFQFFNPCGTRCQPIFPTNPSHRPIKEESVLRFGPSTYPAAVIIG